jgi:hypothetical protein
MTQTMSSTTVGFPDIAEPADDTLPGVWKLACQEPPTPLVQLGVEGWTIPTSPPPEIPSIQVQLRQIRDSTGWSSRTLATLTGTTHPTIEAALEGRTRLARLPGTALRISDLHRFIMRLLVVARSDLDVLVRALHESPGDGRPSAVELLGSGDLTAAYTAALDVLRPPRSTAMMRSVFPARPGEATTPLSDQ